jgi:hypothetical protein
MNDMFREYSTWRTKLEQIEGKMRGDVEFWKQAAEKAHRDNERAQREAEGEGAGGGEGQGDREQEYLDRQAAEASTGEQDPRHRGGVAVLQLPQLARGISDLHCQALLPGRQPAPPPVKYR